MTRPWTVAAALVCVWVLAAGSAPAAAGGAQTLLARHAQLQDALAHSPFRRPLLLAASGSTSAPFGEVHAVLDHAFETVRGSLQRAGHWCDVLILQTNIKRCAAAGNSGAQRLEVAVARRYTDPVDEAQAISFRYELQAARPGYLSVKLTADEGPVGTRNYRLHFEAVPIGPQQTFVHMSYAYEPGLMARMATSAYLASAGRDKVGFSIAGRDGQGRPVLVGGIQGVAERNTMRYFLAIESFLATLDVSPEQRLDQRLRHFHAALERHPAQLHETELGEYLAMKRREAGRPAAAAR